MYVPSSELFQGVTPDFLRALNDNLVKEQRGAGEILYKSGEPATHFYILEEGLVTLSYGPHSCIVYVLNKGGETFGLSSLLRESVYAATAECKAPSKLKKIHREQMEKLLAAHPDSGRVFFKSLAGTLFQRMLDSCNSLLSTYQGAGSPSYG